MASTSVVHVPQSSALAVSASDFSPVFDLTQAVARKKAMTEFIGQILTEGTDYGIIPGTNKEKVLKKPGAEKLCSFFGFSPRIVDECVIEDWSGVEHGGEPLFYYRYKCQLFRGDRFIAEAIGSCNSRESKYRYRWIDEHEAQMMDLDLSKLKKRGGRKVAFEPIFALDKRETTGRFGKPEEYWQTFDDAIIAGTARKTEKEMGKGDKRRPQTGWEIEMDSREYRVPNPDICDVVNTVQKIATKRTLVAAVLIGTNASDSFTQDIEEDLEHGETSAAVADRRIAEETTKANGKPVPVNARLDALLKRCTGIDAGEAVLYEVYQAIMGLTTEEHAQRAWAEALAKFGDPEKKPRALAPVMEHLLADLEKQEAAKAQKPLPLDTP